MRHGQNWPERLWLVRHGQSQGNVARDLANELGHAVIKLDIRDVDVPLSDLGHAQAEATGRWFAAMPEDERPEVILASPYTRAKPTIIDERLREREFGMFDGLTSLGIKERFPEEASHRAKMGKFYHRAPGGESWADVILRLRSMMNTINLQYADRRVLVVCHQVVVLCMRYILEELTEGQILAVDKQEKMLNCGVCAFDFEPDKSGICVPKLELWNYGAPMEIEGTEQTAEPEMMTGSR